MTPRILPPLLWALTLSGCGSSSGDGGGGGSGSLGTCGIRASITGGTAIEFTGNDDAACATLHSFASGMKGLDGIFIGTNAKGSLELGVRNVGEGETGDYPTRIVVTNMAKEHWQGDVCTTTISEHRLLKKEASDIGELRHYQVSGDGTCDEPVPSFPPGGPDVSVGPFAFSAEFTWRD